MRNSLFHNIVNWFIGFVFAVAIFGFVFGIATGVIDGGNITMGINGMTETRCINGFKFIVGQNGSTQQVLNENGGGVSCF